MSKKGKPTTQHFVPPASRQADGLDAPLMVDPGDASPRYDLLHPGATPAGGAVFRIPAYDSMQPQDVIELTWRGKTTYRTQTFVLKPGLFVDIKVPRNVVLDNSEADTVVMCTVSYTVTSGDGQTETSQPATIYVVSDFPAPPPVRVPDASNGELDFSAFIEDGLPVEFPDDLIIMGRWLCYTPAGRRNEEVRFAVQPGETVRMWREVLQQVERNGEVRIWYTGSSGGLISPSMTVAIRAL